MLCLLAIAMSLPDIATLSPETAARDEALWQQAALCYPAPPPGTINLEHGNFGAMALPVQDAYEQGIRLVNERLSPFVREDLAGQLDALRDRIAQLINASRDEILLTRNASESMQVLIAQYRHLQPGDVVLWANLDYPAMRNAMRWLEERRGVRGIELQFDLPLARETLLARYRQAIANTPGLKLILLSQVYPCNGQLTPVAEIVALAREHGIDVLVDSAHALGQVPLDVEQLGIDFAGFNLHKWIGAPIGTGFVYIRRSKLDRIEPHFGDRDYPESDIRCRLHSGTPNIGALLAVPAALDFHAGLGGARVKRARLLYLRSIAVRLLAEVPGLRLLSPAVPEDGTALLSFSIDGLPSPVLQKGLWQRLGIYTVVRFVGTEEILRATFAVTTKPDDIARLAEALQVLVQEGRQQPA